MQVQNSDAVKRIGLSQANSTSCQTPEKHLKPDSSAKTLGVSALAYTAIEERRIQNTNIGQGQGKFAAGERGGGAGRRRQQMW